MSIRYRLVLIMVGLSVLGVCLASGLAHAHSEANLKDAAVRQLAGLRRSRAYQIESYFRTVRNHVLSLSDDRMLVDAMQEFGGAYAKLDSLPSDAVMRQAVSAWYEQTYLPDARRFMILSEPFRSYLPIGTAAYWLQDQYVIPQDRAVHSLQLDRLGAAYTRVYGKYGASLRRLVNQFGYYDLLLVYPKDLRVIYSSAHNPDFGTSLSIGPYRDTSLASIAASAMTSPDAEAVFVADYSRYTPLDGAPAAFVATPISDGSSRAGAFVLQISTHEIDRVVSGNRAWEADGLGKTGDVEIVGPDRLMRSTSRRFIEHPADFLKRLQQDTATQEQARHVRSFGTTILSAKVRLSAVAEGLKGREGTTVEAGPDGHEQIVSFMPLKIPGLHWVLLAHMDLDEALDPVYRFRREAILWSIIAVLLTGIVALLITEQLLRPIKRLLAAAKRMSAGDLTARVHVRSSDELGVLSAAFNTMSESIQQSIAAVEEKNRENENLLLNILPGPIAHRLKSGETAIADSYPQATVLFADVVGFTNISATRQPAEILEFLNGLFTRFDNRAKCHGIEKIKTIGDAYMAVSGILASHPDHLKQMLEMALDMLDAIKDYQSLSKIPFSIRIGINTGPVVAGVIGTTKFIYDRWGDTVNMASRMESTGVPGSIQVTRSVYEQVSDQYDFEARGSIEVKGKGLMETWLLHAPDCRPGSNPGVRSRPLELVS
ncbi:MAG: adenylate/guanylate cyclase domain-containing protein [Bryobacteraceae bacterium]